jgi:hypothetical protein
MEKICPKPDDIDELELWNSRALNFHYYSKYPQLLELINSILGELVGLLKNRSDTQRIHKVKLQSSLSLAIINLYSAHNINPDKYVAYPRNPGGFKKTRYKRHNVGYDVFVKVVNTLEATGYIENHLGFYDRFSGTGRISRMRATSRLTRLFEEYKLAGVMIQRKEDEEVIILKSVSVLDNNKKDKFVVDYEDTTQTNKMRDNLHSINSLLHSRWFDIKASDKMYREMIRQLKNKGKEEVDFTRKRLARIFNNNSFEDGGRFYHGWWQEIPKQYRKLIEIDGKITVEVDYSSIHFRILYAEQGIDIGDTDPYIIKGYEDKRNIIKIALNIILNADTKDAAIKAMYMHKKLNIDKDTAIGIYIRLEEEHPRIKKYFGSGKGIKLQYIDSQIAEQVMLNLAKDDIVCLPVHDSFIVRLGHKIYLEEEMDKVFKEIVGVQAKRAEELTIFSTTTHKEENERLFGNRGMLPSEEDIVSLSDLDFEEFIKIKGEYEGYNQRRQEWIKHKRFL